jgi:hypothetical protein
MACPCKKQWMEQRYTKWYYNLKKRDQWEDQEQDYSARYYNTSTKAERL